MSPAIALQEIENCKGTQFDPELVDVFLKVYNEGKIEAILQKKG